MPKNGGCCSKNVYKISIEGGKERRKTEIIQELVIEFSFDILLKIVEITRSPNLEQVKTMLEEAFTEKYWGIPFFTETKSDNINTLLIIILEDKGIQSSISHKGNSPDNGMMESFLAF